MNECARREWLSELVGVCARACVYARGRSVGRSGIWLGGCIGGLGSAFITVKRVLPYLA